MLQKFWGISQPVQLISRSLPLPEGQKFLLDFEVEFGKVRFGSGWVRANSCEGLAQIDVKLVRHCVEVFVCSKLQRIDGKAFQGRFDAAELVNRVIGLGG